jgi:hypothetical protein
MRIRFPDEATPARRSVEEPEAVTDDRTRKEAALKERTLH